MSSNIVIFYRSLSDIQNELYLVENLNTYVEDLVNKVVFMNSNFVEINMKAESITCISNPQMLTQTLCTSTGSSLYT